MTRSAREAYRANIVKVCGAPISSIIIDIHGAQYIAQWYELLWEIRQLRKPDLQT